MTRLLLAEPHHDGSELYVPDPPAALGDEVTVRLRVPLELGVEHVALRYTHDGEPRLHTATLDEQTETEQWWSGRFTAYNPVTRYRWLVAGGELGYAWVTGAGLESFDVPDSDDFTIAVGASGPEWHPESVVYEVFPDRFATTGGAVGEPPEWAVRREWDEAPAGSNTGPEWFGGDLRGIEERLDHLERLGVNVLYLTPIFPAGSTHRYDAHTFDHVDPLLGGDDALASLTAAAHARGIRVVGDLTLNHCGDGHDWFRAARADEDAPERSFFLFDEGVRHGYETWLGVRTLPKLDHRSPELRRRLASGPTSVVQRWLREPFDLDGWRIDVANMTGRCRDVDVNLDVAAAVRGAVTEARADGLLLAEHGHDYRADLRGDGWQGAMNYMGFLRPIWAWLRGDELPRELADGFLGLPVGVPEITAHAAVESMRRFRAGVPWESVVNSWTLLDSHDTARFSVVAGDRDRQLVGVGLQMTTPGVPMVWAGDELGLGGAWGEDARRPMPWGSEDAWDEDLLAAYRRLIALRKGSDALARGGIRYAAVADDAFAYLRESPRERILCLAARAPHEAVRLPLTALGCSSFDLLEGDEVEIAGGDVVLPSRGPAFHAWRLIS
jgi:alpha-glucosidase